MGAAIVTPEGLTAKQEEFCQVYTSQDRELFGNGVQSYLEIFDVDKTKPDWYHTAASAASRLLQNVKVIERINTLLAEGGLNDGHADKQLLFVMNQFSDIPSKLNAYKEFNKLRQRITEKHDITSGGKPITVVQMNYGDISAVPVQPETLPAPSPEGDGQRDKESGNRVAPEIG